MRKIFMFIAGILSLAVIGTTTGCRFATSVKDGDTVAASEFEPADTTKADTLRTDTARRIAIATKDSTDIFYIGTGSTKQFIQLVSYPSRRDTMVYGKTRHIRVKGNADYGKVVRIRFYLLGGKDSLVSGVEQIDL